MEYSYSMGESLLEWSLMGESLWKWESDVVLFNGGVDIDLSTLNRDPAPISFGDVSLKSETNHGLQVEDDDWMSTGVDFLVDFVNNDFNASIVHQPNGQESTSLSSSALDCCKQIQPVYPANCYDSGVDSPGSDMSSVLLESSPTSIGDVTSNIFGNELPQLLESSPTSIGDVTSGIFENELPQLDESIVLQNNSPTYFSFPLHNADEQFPASTGVENELLEQLGISFMVQPFQHAEIASQTSAPPLELSGEATQLTFEDAVPIVDASDETATGITNIVNVEVSHGSELPQCSASPEALQQPVQKSGAPSKSRCGRKSKITTLEEKRKRKRDQNKTAATRYRERKRQEAEERESEYAALNTRNKELKDKTSQISREINYLKELMIEVHTIKGLIS